MNRIVCETYEELSIGLDKLSGNQAPRAIELTIGSSVEFPLRDQGNTDFRFETRDDPFLKNYRKQFLRPSEYYAESFTEEGCQKINTLATLVKAGGTIIFIVDSEKENSLINACCFLREYLIGFSKGKKGLTIPFPCKKANLSPNDWIWSCYWKKTFSKRLDELQSEKFINKLHFNFHKYDRSVFPVKIIHEVTENEKGEEGKRVTAFSVSLRSDEGQVRIITPRTKDISGELGIGNTNSSSLKIHISKREQSLRFSINKNDEEKIITATQNQVLKFLIMYAVKSTPGTHLLFQNKCEIIIRKGESRNSPKILLDGIFNNSSNYNTEIERTLTKILSISRNEIGEYLKKEGNRNYKSVGVYKEAILKNINTVKLDTTAKQTVEEALKNNQISTELKVFILSPFCPSDDQNQTTDI